VFAEFLIAAALRTTNEPRLEWDLADLRYREALIEVKSSADNQVWEQTKPSTIRFDVARKLGWNAATNDFATARGRSAQIYIFCHYHGPANSREVVVLDHWDFYVLPTITLDAELDDQKSMGLGRLRSMAEAISFDDVRAAVDVAIERMAP
jgi:hypothetical protein